MGFTNLVIPAIILIVIFSYIPMWGVLTVLQDYRPAKGFFGSKWVGLKYFRMFFEAPDFGLIMRYTVLISLLKLLVAFPALIVLALMLNEKKRAVQAHLPDDQLFAPLYFVGHRLGVRHLSAVRG